MTLSGRMKAAIALCLLALGIASRFLPHAWDFTPVTAIVLFSAAYLGLAYSFFLLFAVMIATDLFLGFYEWHVMLAVYGSFALAGLIGLFLNKRPMGSVFMGTISSSVLFFAVTNWAVWQFGTLYPRSLAGLLQCYFMALPFFRNALAGDLFYAGVLFGTYALVARFAAHKQEASSAAVLT